MCGYIIGKDNDGIWILAKGDYTELESLLEIYKQLADTMDVRLVSMDKQSEYDLKSIEEKFISLF